MPSAANLTGCVRWPDGAASRASSGHDQRESGAPDSLGNWQVSALTSAICNAMNVGGCPDRLRSARGGHPAGRESAAPAAHDVHVQVGFGGGLGVAAASCCQEHDRRPLARLVRGLVAVGHLLDLVALGSGQFQGHGGAHGHGRRAAHLSVVEKEVAEPTSRTGRRLARATA